MEGCLDRRRQQEDGDGERERDTEPSAEVRYHHLVMTGCAALHVVVAGRPVSRVVVVGCVGLYVVMAGCVGLYVAMAGIGPAHPAGMAICISRFPLGGGAALRLFLMKLVVRLVHYAAPRGLLERGRRPVEAVKRGLGSPTSLCVSDQGASPDGV